MAPSRPSRPESKGDEAGETNSRINRKLPKRGKYRPRKAAPERSTPGQRIRAARIALGLTQKELGERLHTDQTTVSAWETDKPKKLAGPSLVALSEVFGTTPEALLTGTGFKIPDGPNSTTGGLTSKGSECSVIELPPAPPEGHLLWVEKGGHGHPRLLEGKLALKEIKKALASNRQLWLVVQ